MVPSIPSSPTLIPLTCCLEAPCQVSFFTHLSSPWCRFRHMMAPVSRAAIPRPPRIPRARARVPSPDPPTEPVGRFQKSEGTAPPLTVPFLFTIPPVTWWGYLFFSDFNPIPYLQVVPLHLFLGDRTSQKERLKLGESCMVGAPL
jgi:hypothetical protein